MFFLMHFYCETPLRRKTFLAVRDVSGHASPEERQAILQILVYHSRRKRSRGGVVYEKPTICNRRGVSYPRSRSKEAPFPYRKGCHRSLPVHPPAFGAGEPTHPKADSLIFPRLPLLNFTSDAHKRFCEAVALVADNFFLIEGQKRADDDIDPLALHVLKFIFS